MRLRSTEERLKTCYCCATVMLKLSPRKTLRREYELGAHWHPNESIFHRPGRTLWCYRAIGLALASLRPAFSWHRCAGLLHALQTPFQQCEECCRHNTMGDARRASCLPERQTQRSLAI